MLAELETTDMGFGCAGGAPIAVEDAVNALMACARTPERHRPHPPRTFCHSAAPLGLISIPAIGHRTFISCAIRTTEALTDGLTRTRIGPWSAFLISLIHRSG